MGGYEAVVVNRCAVIKQIFDSLLVSIVGGRIAVIEVLTPFNEGVVGAERRSSRLEDSLAQPLTVNSIVAVIGYAAQVAFIEDVYIGGVGS